MTEKNPLGPFLHGRLQFGYIFITYIRLCFGIFFL